MTLHIHPAGVRTLRNRRHPPPTAAATKRIPCLCIAPKPHAQDRRQYSTLVLTGQWLLVGCKGRSAIRIDLKERIKAAFTKDLGDGWLQPNEAKIAAKRLYRLERREQHT